MQKKKSTSKINTGFTPVFKIYKKGTTTGGPVTILKENGQPYDIGAKKAFYLALGYAILPLITPEALANSFGEILTSWHTPEQMEEVNRLNKTNEYSGGSCASHNYFDANEAMVQAFKIVTGKEINFQSDIDIELINAAWNIARENNFQTVFPALNMITNHEAEKLLSVYTREQIIQWILSEDRNASVTDAAQTADYGRPATAEELKKVFWALYTDVNS